MAGLRRYFPQLLPFVVLGLGVVAGFWPWPVAVYYVAISGVTYLVYWWDKRRATQGGWRVAENTLHLLSASGGWPGALLAQQWLRHKSSKTSFQLQFWLMVLINVAAVLWLCSPYGRHVLA